MLAKVGLLGASGRMGLEIAGLLRDGFVHAGKALELCDAVCLKKKFKSIEGVPVRTLTEPEFDPAHIWIDFSSPSATLSLLKLIDTPIVIGTTGFTPQEFSAVEAYASNHPVFFAPNMSPGINWVLSLLGSHLLPGKENYRLVLAETHHENKKDSPSGTLKRIAETLAQKGYSDPTVHVTRAGEVLGFHEVKFISNDEEITISHRVNNRSVFARGALMAAVFLLRQEKPGLYNFESLENMK